MSQVCIHDYTDKEMERTKYLYLLAAGPQSNRITAPPIAASLMSISLYAPFWLSLAVQVVCMVAVYATKGPTQGTSHQEYTAVSNTEPVSPAFEAITASSRSPSPTMLFQRPSQSSAVKHKMSGWNVLSMRKAKDIAKLFKTPASWFCLVAFFVKRNAFASESFIFQYASEKFLWPLRQTTRLRTASGVGSVFALLITWPLVTSILTKKGVPSYKQDLNAIRVSLIIVILSFFWAWRATSGTALIYGKLISRPLSIPMCPHLNETASDGWLWTRRRDGACTTRPFNLSHRLGPECATFYHRGSSRHVR